MKELNERQNQSGQADNRENVIKVDKNLMNMFNCNMICILHDDETGETLFCVESLIRSKLEH